MHLDDETVRAHRHGAHRARLHEAGHAGGVARVDDHGQVREAVQDGDHREVDRVARGRLVGADAAFAEHHVRVAARHDVLGAHEQFLEGGAHAALEENGLLRVRAHLLQEVEVLHVARTDLDHVHVVEQLELLDAHELGHHGEARLALRLDENLEAALAQPLERVGGRARLERAAAQERGAGGLHGLRDGDHLLLALHAARTRDHLEVAAADLEAAAVHHRVLGMELAVRLLVRLLDALDGLHHAEGLHEADVEARHVAHASDDGLRLARAHVRRHAVVAQPAKQAVDLLLVRVLLQRNDHVFLL